MDETQKTNGAAGELTVAKNARRRRWEMTSEDIRYFLPKSGDSSEKPELGQEMATEGEALVRRARTAYRACPFCRSLEVSSGA